METGFLCLIFYLIKSCFSLGKLTFFTKNTNEKIRFPLGVYGRVVNIIFDFPYVKFLQLQVIEYF